jgi:hypothetical protein
MQPSIEQLIHLTKADLLQYGCAQLAKFWDVVLTKYAEHSAEAGTIEAEIKKKKPSVYGGGLFAGLGVLAAAIGLGHLADQSAVDQFLTYIGTVSAAGGGFYLIRDARDLVGMDFDLERFASKRDKLRKLRDRLREAMKDKGCPDPT